MADLQSCYFCASPDDVAEYAVVPPRLGGGDRSVALCPDCKTKLLRVMDPLIERAEEGADGGGTAEPSVDDSDSQDTAADSGVDDDAGGITMSASGSDAGDEEGESPEAEPEGASTTPATPAVGGDADAPPQYRRAMRMLSNRPFPVERTEVESMLANAYDLEREEIEAVLDHAKSEGRLVEEDGQLRRP